MMSKPVYNIIYLYNLKPYKDINCIILQLKLFLSKYVSLVFGYDINDVQTRV